jgi:hypothetical protein
MPKRRPSGPRGGSAPKKPRDKKFCERWLVHFDKKLAYTEAGFKANPKNIDGQAGRKLERFMEYLRPFQEAKAREVARLVTLEQEDILKAMSRKAVFDPGEYVERSAEPLLEEIGRGKKKITRVREWHGRPVHAERMKPFTELTPEQRLTVEITGQVGDQITYRLPTHREQHAAQVAIGRQFGMFLDKLIIERHQSRGGHQTLALEGVPTTKLQEITWQLLPFVGQEFASRLGFTLEDIEEAKARVVATQPKRPD